jgi:hypothetical protein
MAAIVGRAVSKAIRNQRLGQRLNMSSNVQIFINYRRLSDAPLLEYHRMCARLIWSDVAASGRQNKFVPMNREPNHGQVGTILKFLVREYAGFCFWQPHSQSYSRFLRPIASQSGTRRTQTGNEPRTTLTYHLQTIFIPQQWHFLHCRIIRRQLARTVVRYL